jgi:hypothetical protein
MSFAPGTQDEAVAGTNYAPQYSKLGVYLTVGALTQPTEMTSNGYTDGNPQTSSVVDFSAALHTSCSAGDPYCRDSVTIKVSKPNYDYWCLNFYMYCPWSGVYETHPWHGTLNIQTDDTQSL